MVNFRENYHVFTLSKLNTNSGIALTGAYNCKDNTGITICYVTPARDLSNSNPL
jgi:hypothetical protein